MRQGQHNKRARGRGRKPQNVNRAFESNGPDVKIRGTAATIAEKYLSLARDAQASGDPVASENYLQHAEHYLRIIAAAQSYSQNQHQSEQPSTMNGHGADDDDQDDRSSASESGNDNSGGSRPAQEARGDQPSAEGGEESAEGRSRRSRSRRNRRPAPDDASARQQGEASGSNGAAASGEGAASGEAAASGDAADGGSDKESGSPVVVEAT